MFLIKPWSKFARMVPLCQTKKLPELLIRNIFKRLVQIQNNFTEMFLMMPSTKIDQNIQLGWTTKHRNIFKWYLFSHRPIHHLLMCQDSGEQSLVRIQTETVEDEFHLGLQSICLLTIVLYIYSKIIVHNLIFIIISRPDTKSCIDPSHQNGVVYYSLFLCTHWHILYFYRYFSY